MSLIKLFLIYVKIGAILLGGGYVILPIIINEFSEKRNLLSKDEVIEFYTLSQSLPGIVAANVSMFMGYKLRGKSGAIAAMTGVIFIPFWIIVVLASLINTLAQNIYIQGALEGVEVAVICLIILTVRELWQNSSKDWYYYIILLISLVFLEIFHLTPIQTILLAVFIGLLIKKILKEVK